MSKSKSLYRICHLSDIHFTTTPTLHELLHLKRIFGIINQYVYRYNEFTIVQQIKLVEYIKKVKIDAIIISGDITSMALESEYKLAYNTLDPIISKVPTFIIPGNHDSYISSSYDLLYKYFGKYMGKKDNKSLPIFKVGPHNFIGLNPCRPRLFDSSGEYPKDQLDKLGEMLNINTNNARKPFIVTHYPPLTLKPNHSVSNNIDLINIIKGKISGLLHGHLHKSSIYKLEDFPVYNAGSCSNKNGGFYIYNVIDKSVDCEIYKWDINTKDYYKTGNVKDL